MPIPPYFPGHPNMWSKKSYTCSQPAAWTETMASQGIMVSERTYHVFARTVRFIERQYVQIMTIWTSWRSSNIALRFGTSAAWCQNHRACRKRHMTFTIVIWRSRSSYDVHDRHMVCSIIIWCKKRQCTSRKPNDLMSTLFECGHSPPSLPSFMLRMHSE